MSLPIDLLIISMSIVNDSLLLRPYLVVRQLSVVGLGLGERDSNDLISGAYTTTPSFGLDWSFIVTVHIESQVIIRNNHF